MNELPCAKCKAMCCGPVPLSSERLRQIDDYLSTKPAAEMDQLRRQKRGTLDCRFIDKRDHTCTIYPVRPELCRAFGRIDQLICPVVKIVINPIPVVLAEMNIDRDSRAVEMLSSEYPWGQKSND